MSCMPDAWQTDIISPSGEDLARIRMAKTISVIGRRGSVLCSGSPVDIVSTTIRSQEATTIILIDGERFWRASVALSAASGTSVEQTVRLIVERCSEPTQLAYLPNAEQALGRGQTFFGRAADALDDFSRGMGWRAYTYMDAVYVVDRGTGLRETTLQEDDLFDIPHPMRHGAMLKTDVIGMMPGQFINIRADNMHSRMRLISQTIDADNEGGPWDCVLSLVNEDAFVEGWEGV